jgi:hypothetical protein
MGSSVKKLIAALCMMAFLVSLTVGCSSPATSKSETKKDTGTKKSGD